MLSCIALGVLDLSDTVGRFELILTTPEGQTVTLRGQVDRRVPIFSNRLQSWQTGVFWKLFVPRNFAPVFLVPTGQPLWT